MRNLVPTSIYKLKSLVRSNVFPIDRGQEVVGDIQVFQIIQVVNVVGDVQDVIVVQEENLGVSWEG